MAESRTAIGLMSGTSLDGVDVALLSTDGEAIVKLGAARTYPYAEADRQLLRQATIDARHLSHRDDRPGVLPAAEALVTLRHAEAVEAFLAAEGLAAEDVHVVGFHGQTVFHDPKQALTVQIGDGQELADRLGIPVVWDMRANDMAEGGEGAPLAPVFHRALARAAGCCEPILFLNLGGVANVTYVGPDDVLIAFDTGTGNALLDDWALSRLGHPFDHDGALAASGTASATLLAELLDHPYFAAPPPKSLDRDAFTAASVAELPDADGAATLLRFSVAGIVRSFEHLPHRPAAIYASGGGRHNRELMRVLREEIADIAIKPIEALGFDGDATEAQAFAFLAVRSLHGMPLTFPTTTGAPDALGGGITSKPKTCD